MRLFPRRSREEKLKEVRDWVLIFVYCCVVAAIGLGLFLAGNAWLSFLGETASHTIGIAGLVIGVLAAVIAIQALFHIVIESTIGPEKFVAAFVVLMVIGGIMTWLS